MSPLSPEMQQQQQQQQQQQATSLESPPPLPVPRQALQMRLQKPTVVLDLAFLLPLAEFFTSTAAPQGGLAPTAQLAVDREVLLGEQAHLAQVGV